MYSVLLMIAVLCLIPCRALAVEPASHAFDYMFIMQEPERYNYCALTFDDGPTAFSNELLDALQEEGVKATFFVLGKQVAMRPGVVRRMAAEGHEVGMHGYSHSNMRHLKASARAYELDATKALLQDLGITPRYFRPPYGNYDNALVRLTKKRGLDVVLWSTDSRDWKVRWVDYYNMPNCLGVSLSPDRMRGVFLFHDTRRRTAAEVHRMISSLREIGCRNFVTVHEYFTRRPVPASQEAQRLVAQDSRVLSDRGGDFSSPNLSKVGEQLHVLQSYSLPAGGTPIPMSRSSRPWLRPLFLRGE